MQRYWLLMAVGVCACAGGIPRGGDTPKQGGRAPSKVQLTCEQRVSAARDAFDASNYVAAERDFAACVTDAAARRPAALGLARVYEVTGRYPEVLATAPVSDSWDEDRVAQQVLRARALRATGRVEEAAAELAAVPDAARTGESTVLAGEILLELGKRDAAEAVLMTLIEQFNDERIAEDDSDGFGYVARAAQLMRSPEDANEAFNLAEQAGNVSVQTLLWRARLHLDGHDPEHAAELLAEIFERAPNHPVALALSARLRIDEALDFDEAERLARRALEVNPKLGDAYAVLGALRLRDTELVAARRELEQGLAVNPRSLELMSLLGATAFLADEPAELAKYESRVLGYNAQYSTFYTLVGLYAEWEHRYDDIVELMRRAVKVDPEDGSAWAQLGLNEIRGGDDQAGLVALRAAFALDPYDVRTFNTLNLFEKVIPSEYVQQPGARFRIRYPKAEQPILSEYVPPLLEAAWAKMTKYYEFVPTTPVGIELYAERSHFAIRTSGLPDTAIQGVCFGKTLASISPGSERFNIGMTLWHELSHVFHIQLSRNHVPRWFTEGLAEYETLVERPEWQRELDEELFAAYRDKRLPKIGSMNEAFTHAEEVEDVGVAYYASTQIVRMLAEKHGRAKLRQMLVSWGEGKTTAEVVQLALGATTEQLDAEFEQFLSVRLARYGKQFVPRQRVGNAEAALRAARAKPRDVDALYRVALLAFERGQLDAATTTLRALTALDANHADAIWLEGSLALRKGDPGAAAACAERLMRMGRDGYATRMLLARAAQAKNDPKLTLAALQAATAFDASQRAPIDGLRELSRDGAAAADLDYLRQIVALDEHDAAAHLELLRGLVEQRDFAGAAQFGPSAVHANVESAEVHLYYGLALEAVGERSAAERELRLATLCPEPPEVLASIESAVADFWDRRGNPANARPHRARAQELSTAAKGAAEQVGD